MTEHTPTPWRVEQDTDLIWGACNPDDKSSYGMGYAIVEGKSGERYSGYKPEMDERQANAAFIVKAVNNHVALLEFFKWAMREGPWDGGDLDGASVQDKAKSLGLIVKTQYDAEKHGVQSDFEEGDDWFEYKPDLRVDVSTPPGSGK